MHYRALIQNRKSVRAFSDKEVPYRLLEEISAYYCTSVRRLIPELETKLYFFGTNTREALEGAAGYNSFLVGSPQYLVLMSEPGDHAGLNAGYMMEDLVLHLTDLELDSCWLTFTDSDHVKEALGIDSDMDVAAIVAFGYGKKTVKRLRLNILSMSNVDVRAKHRYMEPKRGVSELVYLNTWGNSHNVIDHIGFFDDMLWESLYAVSLAPSYLNRQAYGFVIHDGAISLIRRPDEFTTEADGALSLGIALLHFSAVAEEWAGRIRWALGSDAARLPLPEGHQVIATCVL